MDRKEGNKMHRDECFVIAPIGEENDEKRKRTDQVFKFIISKAVEGKYQAVLAHKLGKPGKISINIIEKLVSVPLVIADLTDNNANVYYELALRQALNMPAILLIEEKQKNDIPFDLKDMRVISYDLQDPEKLDRSVKELSIQIEIVENNSGIGWDIFPEEISLTLEPNVPGNHKVLLGTLLLANRIRHELIEPYFEGLLDLESRNRKLKFTFQQLLRESARKEYLQKNKILFAFTNREDKDSIERLFDDVELIITKLGIAISSHDENAIKEQLSRWRINNSRFLQIWVKQYEKLLLEANSTSHETPERSQSDDIAQEAVTSEAGLIQAVYE
jgi:hypothetical protein